jgi:AP2 domain
MRRPYRKSNRYCGVCDCGDHAWAILTKGYITLVSPEDAHLLQERKWHATKRGSTTYAEGNPHIALHRLIAGGEADVDHKDHNGTNNRRGNLRPCSRSQNLGNSRHRVGASGFRGVTPEKRTGRWQAQIARLKLGTFPTAEAAARAYDAAAIERFGHFASLNFEGSE